ncbi:MAG: hypothetical protein H0T52_13200 [Lautropia sp.]|nr:hypothetical protein [Lautropia sp.]
MVPAQAAAVGFSAAQPGGSPEGWICGSTGGGKPLWRVEPDSTAAARIRVLLNGKPYIEQDDGQLGGEGKVGVWTKADSVTAFEAFAYGSSGR